MPQKRAQDPAITAEDAESLSCSGESSDNDKRRRERRRQNRRRAAHGDAAAAGDGKLRPFELNTSSEWRWPALALVLLVLLITDHLNTSEQMRTLHLDYMRLNSKWVDALAQREHPSVGPGSGRFADSVARLIHLF